MDSAVIAAHGEKHGVGIKRLIDGKSLFYCYCKCTYKSRSAGRKRRRKSSLTNLLTNGSSRANKGLMAASRQGLD